MSNNAPINIPRKLLPRAVAFLIIFLAFQMGWQALRGTPVERVVIHDATVQPATFLINMLTPSRHAHAVMFRIDSLRGGVLVANGCEGMDAVFLLLAAFAVTPVSWSARGTGVLFGTVVVFAVNQARILSLFYAVGVNPRLFETLHEIVAPIVVILLMSGYFYGWLLRTINRTVPAR
jgi:exosortase family protein XrtM